MRIPSLLIASVLCASSAWAQHDSHYYLQIGQGIVFSADAEDVPGGEVSFDPGYAASLAFGYQNFLGDNLSFSPEIEVYYQNFRVDEDDLQQIPSAVEDDAKAFAVMLNGTIDWYITEQFSWYGGLGIGYATDVEYSAWDSGNLVLADEDGLAAQARLGLGYNLGGSYDVRVGVRYFQIEALDIEDQLAGTTDELEVGQLAIEALLRWGF